MALDSRLVDLVFTRLLVRYGARWLQAYPADIEQAMRIDWAAELDGVPRWRIEGALANLPPDWPPDAGRFRKLCADARDATPVPALPAPTGSRNSDAARMALERMREVTHSKAATAKGREWALALKDRHERGDGLTLAQIEMYRDALRQPSHEEAV